MKALEIKHREQPLNNKPPLSFWVSAEVDHCFSLSLLVSLLVDPKLSEPLVGTDPS